MNKKAILLGVVVVLILSAISTALVIEGRKREDPSTVVWEAESWDDFAMSGSEFFISDGVLYGGGGYLQRGFRESGHVIAVDLEEDELLWNHDHHMPTGRINSVHVTDGIVYSGCYSGGVVVADAEHGELLWNHSYHDYLVWSVHSSDNAVYSGCRDGLVIAAEEDSGEKLWEHTFHDSSIFSVYSYEGIVYSSSGDGSVVAVDAESGEMQWRHQHHEASVGSLYVVENIVYSGSGEGELIAYDAERQEKLWSRSHHDESVSSIYLKDGIVYSGGGDGYVIAADSSDGEKLWSHSYHKESTSRRSWRTSSDSIISIQVVEDEVYSLDNNGNALAVEKEGSLTLGISRTWSSFLATASDHLGVIVLILAIILGAVGLLWGKHRELPEESSTIDKKFS